MPMDQHASNDGAEMVFALQVKGQGNWNPSDKGTSEARRPDHLPPPWGASDTGGVGAAYDVGGGGALECLCRLQLHLR